MNYLKLLTKNGRKDIVRQLLKENVTVDALTGYATTGVNSLLTRIENKEKLGEVALAVKRGCTLGAKVSGAIEDGTVTAEEATEITTATTDLAGAVITQDKIDALIEKVVSYVP